MLKVLNITVFLILLTLSSCKKQIVVTKLESVKSSVANQTLEDSAGGGTDVFSPVDYVKAKQFVRNLKSPGQKSCKIGVEGGLGSNKSSSSSLKNLNFNNNSSGSGSKNTVTSGDNVRGELVRPANGPANNNVLISQDFVSEMGGVQDLDAGDILESQAGQLQVQELAVIESEKQEPWTQESQTQESQTQELQTQESQTQELIAREKNIIDDAELVRQKEAKLSDIPVPINSEPLMEYFGFKGGNRGEIILGYNSLMDESSVAKFYNQEMEFFGWETVLFFDGIEKLMLFKKPSRFCSISIRGAKGRGRSKKSSRDYKCEIVIFVQN